MRTARLTLGVVVLSLVVVGAAAGPASAQVDSSNGGEVCADAPTTGDSPVIVLPDGSYIHPDGSSNIESTLLPGTEGDLALCSGGDVEPTGAWSIGDVRGISVDETDEYSYRITVTDVTERATADFGPAVQNRDNVNDLRVNITPGRVAVTQIGGESYPVTINDTDRGRLLDANEEYESTLDEMETGARELNNTEGYDPNGSVSNGERLPRIDQTDTVNQSYDEIQSVLFSANTTDALDASENYRSDRLEGIENHLESAKQALTEQTRDAAVGVLGNFFAVLLVGAVLGGVGGRFATNRILSSVEAERRRSSAVDFRPKHLAGQVAIALVLVVGALALALTQDLLGPLGAAIEAVIPL